MRNVGCVINEVCSLVVAVSGILVYAYKIYLADILNQSVASSIAGLISIIGLAGLNLYSLIRNAMRQQNIADIQAMKETWKGRFESELEISNLLRQRIEELRKAYKERGDELDALRRFKETSKD